MSKFNTSGPTLRTAETCAGTVQLAYTERGLYALELPGMQPDGGRPVGEDDPHWLQALARDLAAYFRGEKVCFTCPLDESGYPPFILKVLRETAGIPYGQWTSYGELAAQVNSPRAARAVGQAMARNRTPVVIPCHRVLCSDGSLGGFGCGLPWKERLLNLEGIKWEVKQCK
ncbi:MAG TPA: methylated-DNA--[protein]-cysteine S-methyltransferase [Firmicutes bacterium]|jgi:methylated-DNA-[protein]-cysteine S-methyltransferase|nr:methylated-DNA--[protein]-cysteine S-methyltransferase [Bacillota bacterium]